MGKNMFNQKMMVLFIAIVFLFSLCSPSVAIFAEENTTVNTSVQNTQQYEETTVQSTTAKAESTSQATTQKTTAIQKPKDKFESVASEVEEAIVLESFEEVIKTTDSLTIEIPNNDKLVLEDDANYYFASNPVGTRGTYNEDTEIKGYWSESFGTSALEVRQNSKIRRLSGYNLTVEGGGTLDIKDNVSSDTVADAILSVVFNIKANTTINLYETRMVRAANATTLNIEAGSSLNIDSKNSAGFSGEYVNVFGEFKVAAVDQVAIFVRNSFVIDGGTVEGHGGRKSGVDAVALTMRNNAKLIVSGDDTVGGLNVFRVTINSGSEIYADGNIAANFRWDFEMSDSKMFLNTNRQTPSSHGLNIKGAKMQIDNSVIRIGAVGSANNPIIGMQSNGYINASFVNNSDVEIYSLNAGLWDNSGKIEYTFDASRFFVYSAGTMGINFRDQLQTVTIKNGAKINVSAVDEGIYFGDANVTITDEQTEVYAETRSTKQNGSYGFMVSDNRNISQGNLLVKDGASLKGLSSYWTIHAQNIQVDFGGKIEGRCTGNGIGAQATHNIYVSRMGEIVGLSDKGIGVKTMQGNIEARTWAKVYGETFSSKINNPPNYIGQNGIVAHNAFIVDHATIYGKAIGWSAENGAIVSDNAHIYIGNAGELIEEYQTAQQIDDNNFMIPFDRIKTVANFANYKYSTDKGRIVLDSVLGLKAARPATAATLTAIRSENSEGEIVQFQGVGGVHKISTKPVDLIVYGEIISVVTFDGNGAEQQAKPQTLEVRFPQMNLESMPEEPKRNSFNFIGWNTSPDGSGQAFDLDSVVEDDLTVYALWDAIAPPPASVSIVTFDGNGASQDAQPTSMSVAAPETRLTQMPIDPQKDGFTFVGWNTYQDGNGLVFDINSEIISDITVYAQWASVDVPPTTSAPTTTTAANVTTTVADNQTTNTPTTAPNQTTTAIQSTNSENVQETTQEKIEETESQAEKNKAVAKRLIDESVFVIEFSGLQIPLYGNNVSEVWALANLVLVLSSVVVSIFIFVGLVKKKDEEDENRQRRGFMWGSIAICGFMIVMLFITENFTKLMVLFDNWTIFYFVMFTVQIALIIVAKTRNKSKNKTEIK